MLTTGTIRAQILAYRRGRSVHDIYWHCVAGRITYIRHTERYVHEL